MKAGGHATQAILYAALSLALTVFQAPLALAGEQYWIYTVRPGDTIWDLTEKHCTDVLHWKRIQRLNNLPDVPARGVLPGTRLKFPIDILKHQPVSASVRLLLDCDRDQAGDRAADDRPWGHREIRFVGF